MSNYIFPENDYHFTMLMAYHILADMQRKMRIEAKYDPSCRATLWCMCKLLCGEEHAQWIFEHKFPKEVLDHDIL